MAHTINFFEKIKDRFNDDPLPALMYFKVIYIKDGAIEYFELKAGADYIVQKANLENPNIFKFNVKHNKTIKNLTFEEVSKFITKIKKNPSSTLRSHLFYKRKPMSLFGS